MAELLSIDDLSKVKNIFDLIDKIEQRTSMFIPDKSIESLSNLLFGYLTCLKIHDIIEKDGHDFNYFGDFMFFEQPPKITVEKRLSCVKKITAGFVQCNIIQILGFDA